VGVGLVWFGLVAGKSKFEAIQAMSSAHHHFFQQNETRFALLTESLTQVQLALDSMDLPRASDGVSPDPAARDARRHSIQYAPALVALA
jgi:hypothetical protein